MPPYGIGVSDSPECQSRRDPESGPDSRRLGPIGLSGHSDPAGPGGAAQLRLGRAALRQWPTLRVSLGQPGLSPESDH
eukprot:228025-Hanusia_phi.AAC.1